MMEGFLNVLMEPLIYFMIIAAIFVMIIKMFKEIKPDRTKREREVKSEDELIYKKLLLNAKSTYLKKKTPVYLRGDKDTPMYKIGTTVAGVLNFQEYVILPIKKKWWNIRESARMLMVEGEAISDLHQGDIIIEGSSIHPITDKFTWVVPSDEMVEKYGDENIQKKREAFANKLFNQQGNWDLNNDVWENTKTAIRGQRASSRREQVRMNIPDVKEQESVERKAEKEHERIEKSEQSQEGGVRV